MIDRRKWEETEAYKQCQFLLLFYLFIFYFFRDSRKCTQGRNAWVSPNIFHEKFHSETRSARKIMKQPNLFESCKYFWNGSVLIIRVCVREREKFLFLFLFIYREMIRSAWYRYSLFFLSTIFQIVNFIFHGHWFMC